MSPAATRKAGRRGQHVQLAEPNGSHHGGRGGDSTRAAPGRCLQASDNLATCAVPAGSCRDPGDQMWGQASWRELLWDGSASAQQRKSPAPAQGALRTPHTSPSNSGGALSPPSPVLTQPGLDGSRMSHRQMNGILWWRVTCRKELTLTRLSLARKSVCFSSHVPRDR